MAGRAARIPKEHHDEIIGRETVGRRQLRQLSDLKEQIESATTSRFSSSMGLAESFPRLRPRPLDEKRGNGSIGESTSETQLVQVRILLPQPASRTNFSPRASGWIFTRHFRQLSPVTC
jgi:hypothetical protein